jgi:hypothetical protein
VKKKKLHYFSIKSFFSPYWIESQDMYKTSHIPNMPLVSIRGGKNGRWTIFLLITKANKRIRICSHYFIRQTKCLLKGIECSLPHKLQIITSCFKYNAHGDMTDSLWYPNTCIWIHGNCHKIKTNHYNFDKIIKRTT